MPEEHRKKHFILKFVLAAAVLAMPLVGMIYFSPWLNLALIYAAALIVWLVIVYLVRLNEINRKEITDQSDNVDDILKLAYTKCIEAREANKSKSAFLASMSHEIRIPINAVLGMNEMILREATEENILKYAANAYNSGNALLSIINDILDISKIEAGKLEISESDYDLYSLIVDCYHMTANRAEKKGLEYRIVCDEKLPSRLKGDMFHIRQIAVNFLTNAIKYTDSGFVELNVSGIWDESGGFSLCFAVKDSGIGLEKENLEKLFTSFQRFDLQRNRTVEGTGLGLSICKQLSERMGGTISAESVYGEGSVFTCVIPQQIVDSAAIGKLNLDQAAAKAEAEEVCSFAAPDARVLVVDDVEMNIFVFTSYLKHHKMKIDTALSGKRCLELAAENTYDVIFMDHMMPEMDGIETFTKLREQGLITEKTPVVMLTANALAGDEEKYMQTGFSSYLSKPVQSVKLEKLLLRLLPDEKIIFRSEEKTAPSPEKTETPAPVSELFDPGLGLKYNGGDKSVYISVLKMYASGGEENLEKIKALEADEDWKNYIIEVHALKSTSLMIGAGKLSEAAKELELGGKAGNTELIKEKTAALLETYSAVLAECRAYLEKEAPPEEEAPERETEEISEEKLKVLAAETESACDGFDVDLMIEKCEEAAGYTYKGAPLKPLFDKVKAAAGDYEYSQAAELIAELKKELEI